MACVIGVVAAAGIAGSVQAQALDPWSVSVFTGGNVGRTTQVFSGSANGAVYSRGSVYSGAFNVGGGIRSNMDTVYSGALSGGIRAGGNVTLNGGSVSGGISSGGSLKSTTGTTTVSGSVNLAGSNLAGSHVVASSSIVTGVSYASGVDFTAMDNGYRAASSLASSLSPTGVAQFSGSTMTLLASASGTNVFNVSASQIANTQSFVINAAQGSTVVINVSGGDIAFANANWSYLGGASASKTIFNAADAWSVTAGGTVGGSLLASNALVTLTGANVHGSVIALGLQGSGNLDSSFAGVIPAPGAWAMVGLGGAMVMRRKRAA